MPLTPGDRLGPYEILQLLGAGGMGEVYRARHLKLRRHVAIKVLPASLSGDPWRLSRFEREARTASALNHPSIVTIYDIAESGGTAYIAMELIEGRTLTELIEEGPLPIDRALDYARQIVDGLAAAHAAGIVHRDIKPANLMVTPDGLVKILDFGLAKPLEVPGNRNPATAPGTTATREGLIVGTPHYMSPEQCVGDPLDHRSDQFAFGIVLFQMVGTRPPFDGPSAQAIMSAILVDPPPPLKRLRPEVSTDLESLVARCLQKEAIHRFPSTGDLRTGLQRCADQRARARRGLPQLLKRPVVQAGLAAAALALAAIGWWWFRGAGNRWAGAPARAEITRLTEAGDLYGAFQTALRAERYRPGDPALSRLVSRVTLPVAVTTDPPGAEVSVKNYATPDAPWVHLGVTPVNLRIPYALMRWRITKEGYEPFEGAPFSSGALGALARGLPLDPAGARPEGMVHVPGGPLMPLPGTRPTDERPVMIQPFFLDRYEVTNREYQAFVTAGGYRRPEWWPRPIQYNGKTIPWQETVRGFVDATGRPGPATWETGSYPAGEDDYPVGGISWYEAAAYCAFAGKRLPTIYHWFHALGQDQLSDILLQSNLAGSAKAPVGQFQGLGAYGTYDMAGNVKEWVWNAAGEGRYILGAAWNEPAYLFKHLIAQDPMGREATNGVRCAQAADSLPAVITAPVSPEREYQRQPPLSDAAFSALRGIYGYDPTPLDARVERVNDSLPNYRRETVSFRTAYGNERMEVHLLIPRDAAPPYQSVVWFPGSDAFLFRSSETPASTYLFDFIPRTGRVLAYPVYQGMYERFEPPDPTPSARRDQMIRWAQDISRTIDYLETRADFDSRRIAYYGFSLGAVDAPVFTAVEPRFAASILLGGGLVPDPWRPEVNPAAFAPRSRTPTLMINGRDDFLMPYELSEKPLFDLLGAPDGKKRHARLDGGHIPTNRLEIIREVLDWLDQQLGPVQSAAVAETRP